VPPFLKGGEAEEGKRSDEIDRIIELEIEGNDPREIEKDALRRA
jgi:hypothetical protein